MFYSKNSVFSRIPNLYLTKRILFLCLLVVVQAAAFAQFKAIATGPTFAAPIEGEGRLLQMKNGYTAFILATPKDGINVRIYDAQHKHKSVQNLKPGYGSLKDANVLSIFECGGQIVLFINGIENKIPVLHRLVIDAEKTLSYCRMNWNN